MRRLLDAVRLRLNEWHRDTLTRRWGGTQICPWCRQCAQSGPGEWHFKPWERDMMFDVLTCSVCGGTSVWLWGLGMQYVRELAPPRPAFERANIVTPVCPTCLDTGFIDHAGFRMDPCDHGAANDGYVAELEQRLSFWADRPTIEEVMAGRRDSEWKSASVERRIELMGDRKRTHDREVLAARAVLARSRGNAA